MMRVIREGDLRRVSTAHRFECSRCGCVFEADSAEYRTESDYRNGIFYAIECPTCGWQVTLNPEDERHGE